MNKEEYQNNNLENIVPKKNELIKEKETFKPNLEKLFVDFKNDSFNPFFEQLKQNIFLIFDDYKINAETKIKEAEGEINIALLNMKDEIDKKLKEADEAYKLKQENLKNAINIQKEKIRSALIENNIFLGNSTLKNNSINDKEIEVKEIVGPTTITISSFGPLSKIILNFVDIGRVLRIQLAKFNRFDSYLLFFGDILETSLLGPLSGPYKLWKYFHKKDDLIELIDKAKSKFMIEYDKFYLNEINLLDEDKKKIIDNFCNLIDNYISEIKNTLNEKEINTIKCN